VKLISLDGSGDSLVPQVRDVDGDKPMESVWSLAFSPIEDSLLVGDGRARVLACGPAADHAWQCRDSAAYPPAENDATRAIAFSPDRTTVAVGRWSGGVDVWDSQLSHDSQRAIDTAFVGGPTYSVTFFSDCQLAVGKGGGLVYREARYHRVAPEPMLPCVGPPLPVSSVGDEVYGLAFDPASGKLAAATRGGYVAILDPQRSADRLRASVPVATMAGEQVRGAILTQRNGTLQLAVAIDAGQSAAGNLELLTLTRRDGSVVLDERVLLAAGEGQIRRLSASEDGHILATLGLRPAPILAVWRVSGDRWMATPSRGCSQDGSHSARMDAFLAYRWRIPGSSAAGPPSRFGGGATRSRRRARCSSLRSTTANRRGSNGRVRVWNVGGAGLEKYNRPDLTMSDFANKVRELTFAADAPRQMPFFGTVPPRRTLLAGGDFGQIDVWDVGRRESRQPQRLDSRNVWLLAYSPHASLVAAADSGHVVRLWRTDPASLEPVQVSASTEATAVPGMLIFGRDGDWLASGAWTANHGGMVHVWDLDVASLSRKACALVRQPGQNGDASSAPLWTTDRGCSAR
jgi:WD40 repeat protein